MSKGKTGNIIFTLAIIAVAAKALTYIASGQLSSADPSGTFSEMISGFLGIIDLVFWGAFAMIVILIPYHLSRRKKQKQVQNLPPAR